MREHVAECLKGRSALVALSGGVDSVVLLHLLLALRAQVVAAHVEHGMRGENSQRDCAFVEALCARLGVPLAVAHVDVPARARASGRGLEETARDLRYAFLREERRRRGLDCILTAHHRNDQAETVLLHLVRGSSPRGLSGMREEEGDLLRPLLPFSRAEILRYAQEKGLPFVQDETNADTAFARNYVRHEVIPRLETLNPRAVEAIARLAALSRDQSDYIAQQADSVLRERMRGDALSDVRDLHPGLRGAVLHEYLVRLGLREAGQADVDRLEGLLPRGRQARQPLRGAAGAGCAGRAARSGRSAHGIHPAAPRGERDAVRLLFPARRGGAPVPGPGARCAGPGRGRGGDRPRRARAARGRPGAPAGRRNQEAQRHFYRSKGAARAARPRAGPDMRRGDRLGGGRRAERRLRHRSQQRAGPDHSI